MSSRPDWDEIGFVLVNPDGVARGLASDVLRRLALAGLGVGGGRLVTVSAQDILLLYPEVQSIEFEYLGEYRMALRLFEYGPALAVAVRRPSGDPRPVHETLRTLKGAPDPGASPPGTLRRDLRGVNRTLRIVHCSNSPHEARTNCETFLHPEQFETVDGAAEDPHDIAALLGEQAGAGRGFLQVLAHVRARVLAAVWTDLGSHGRDLVRKWMERDPLELASRTAGPRLLAELPPTAAERTAPVLGADFRPASRTVDFHCVETELGSLGVRLDRWERLVLETSLHTAPFEWR